MKNTHIYIIILFTFLLTSCLESEVKESDDHGHGHGHEHEGEDIKDVHLSKEQFKMMEITVGGAEKKYISNKIKSSGVLELPPQNKASLSAIAEGRIKSILVTEGVAVRKGQTISLIENVSFIELQKNYLTLKLNNRLLEQDFNRKKKLMKDSIVSEKNFQIAEEAYENSSIQLRSQKAQLSLLGLSISNLEKGNITTSIPVKSPIGGYVRVINVNMNSYVHPGDILFEIVDNEHIHIDLMVFEKDVPFIRKDQRVTFSMSGMPNKIYEAKVFAVGKALEEEQRAMRVHAELKEEYISLLPGMFVDATIYSNDYKDYTLPLDAFIEENGEEFIFIKTKESTELEFSFEKIKVNKGKQFDDYRTIQLNSKVKKGSEIVIKGAFYLNAEINKESFEHSH